MKKPFLILLLFFSCLTTSAQVVTGVYKGYMQVDSPSNTIDFELTLKEKKGKLYGYCYRLFFVEDTVYYNLVKVNARIANDVLIVEDEGSVSNNFELNTRGIKTVFFFKLKDIADSAYILPGEWSTARWRGYLPLTGKITVSRERNYKTTQLYKRLAEKKLDEAMAFEEPKTTPVISPAVAAETKPVTNKPQTGVQQQANTTATLPKKDSVASTAVVQTKTETNTTANAVIQKPAEPVITAPANNQPQPKKQEPVPVTVAPETKTKEQSVVQNNKPQQQKPVTVPPQSKQETKPVVQQQLPPTVIQAPAVKEEKPQSSITKTGQAQLSDSSRLTTKNTITAPPSISNPAITKRETELIQTLSIVEDSVVLSLYDNGEIDGDVVSVFLNNQEIISKVSLSATAYKKAIYLKPGETVQLTLYAETLGTVPPNTGLLVVYSGDQRYQVFFTSTLNKSAVILLKRNL